MICNDCGKEASIATNSREVWIQVNDVAFCQVCSRSATLEHNLVKCQEAIMRASKAYESQRKGVDLPLEIPPPNAEQGTLPAYLAPDNLPDRTRQTSH